MNLIRNGSIGLCVLASLAFAQVLEQQHANWGDAAAMIQPGDFGGQYFRQAVAHEIYACLFDDNDSVGWAFETVAELNGTKKIDGVFIHWADTDATTAQTFGFNFYGEDPMNAGDPNITAPVASFSVALPAIGGMSPGFTETEFTLPSSANPPNTGDTWCGIELGNPTVVAPAVLESPTDVILLGMLSGDPAVPTGAGAGFTTWDIAGPAASTSGTATPPGHGLGIGGYILQFNGTTLAPQFFWQEQGAIAPTAFQPSFSAAATTTQASLPSSNPGAVPGFVTGFFSGQNPAINADRSGNVRQDDIVYVYRNQDPSLQNANDVYFGGVLLSLVGVASPVIDLNFVVPGSVGSLCLAAGPNIVLFSQLNNGPTVDADGYLRFGDSTNGFTTFPTIPNADLAALVAGVGAIDLAATGIVLDLVNAKVWAGGCVISHLEP